MPVNISTTAMILPWKVTGEKSPYPTVVTVTNAHHNAVPKSVIVDPDAPRSTEYTASAPTYMSIPTAPTAYTVMRPRTAMPEVRFSTCSTVSKRNSRKGRSIGSAMVSSVNRLCLNHRQRSSANHSETT